MFNRHDQFVKLGNNHQSSVSAFAKAEISQLSKLYSVQSNFTTFKVEFGGNGNVSNVPVTPYAQASSIPIRVLPQSLAPLYLFILCYL